MSLYLGENKIADNTCSRNIGEIVASTIPLSDAGLHLLDGALISGAGSYAKFVTYIAGLVTDYPDLFETEANWQQSVTTYGVCGKFVYDSVNNTVRLPKITGFTEGTIDPTVLGDLVEAGLPNITGSLNVFTQNISGAFADEGNNGTFGGSTSNHRNISFDASRSNSIYGNSTTVQPQSIKVLYYIVIANSTKTNIEVDIDEIATDLNGKADVDLTNCTTATLSTLATVLANIDYVVESKAPTANDPSWYRVYKSGWVEQGGYVDRSTTSWSGDSVITVTFEKPFAEKAYYTSSQQAFNTSGWQDNANFTRWDTSTATTMGIFVTGDSNCTGVFWEAKGQGA